MDAVEEKGEVLKKIGEQEIEEYAPSDIEEAARNLREAERRNHQLEKRVHALEAKIADSEKKRLSSDDPKEGRLKTRSSSKATFILHFYPREGYYQGRIEHTGDEGDIDTNAFRGIDQGTISDFISSHLPSLVEETKSDRSPMHRKEASATVGERKLRPGVAARPQTRALHKTGILQEIRFQQSKRILEPGCPLRARRPFTLFTRLHFPIAPTTRDLDIDHATYDVQVVTADAEKRNVIARKGVAGVLSAGVSDYENELSMSGLIRGTYLVRIHVSTPFASIDESKDMEMIVE